MYNSACIVKPISKSNYRATRRTHPIRLALAGLMAVSIQVCTAADASPSEIGALRQDMEQLKKSQQSIETTLQDIKRLLQANAAVGAGAPRPSSAVGMSVNVAGKQIRGDKNAKLTLIEFTDYECPFCGRHFRDTAPKIVKNYIETGKIRYVFSDLPLSMHAHAKKAAEAALCAGEQGKYWEMHDLLFSNQQALDNANLIAYATKLELNVPAFQKALESGKYAAKVSANEAEAAKLGFTGAPSFAIGLTQPNDGAIKVIKTIVGAQSYENFEREFADALKPQPSPPPGQTAAAPENPAVGTSMNVAGKEFKGKKDAKLTLIQFSDYECSFCGRLARETIPQVVKDYVDTGKLKFVFSDLALDMHTHAIKAGTASYCAGEQGRYWEMHDVLFSNQGALEDANLVSYAKDMGLDLTKFQQCLETKRYDTQIQQSSSEGRRAGFDATPVEVIGLTEGSGNSVKVLKVISGAVPYPTVQAAIEGILNP